jgi:hypothetical protein
MTKPKNKISLPNTDTSFAQEEKEKSDIRRPGYQVGIDSYRDAGYQGIRISPMQIANLAMQN